MDDAFIRGELEQIFPHLNINVIQRTIEEAKASDDEDEAVDILTRCIDLVLGRQASYSIGRQKSDDVIVVKSIKKERLNGTETRDIPFVYITEDSTSSDRGDCRPDISIFSDCESDSEQCKQFISEIQSSDDEETNSNGLFRITEPPPFSEILHHDLMPETAIQPTHTVTKIHTATPTFCHKQTTAASKTNLSSPPQQSTITKHHCMSDAPKRPSSTISTDLVGSSALDFVKQIFPNVNVDFVKSLSQQGHDLNVIVNTLLERPDMQNACPSEPLWREAAQMKKIDYFKEYSKQISPMYFDQCLALLKNEFRRVPVNDIRYALKICNGHYAPSRKLLEEALLALSESPNREQTSNSISSSAPSKVFRISRLIASKRTCVSVGIVLDDELQLEVDFVKAQAVLKEEEKNAIYAAHINEEQYKDEGQLIECGCCFGEFPFEEIIQCNR